MEVNTTANLTATLSAESLASGNGTKISSDFDTFLRMLTVQMQNQDPLNPVDSTDYAVQLATFSGVEQAVLTNDLLTSMINQMTTSGLGQMSQWVGREVRSAAPTYFDGKPITLEPRPSPISDRAEIVVRDVREVEVQRIPISTVGQPTEWAGIDVSGNPLPQGLYTFEVISIANDEVIAQDMIETYGRVVEIRSEPEGIMVQLAGGGTIAADKVTGLREAG